MSNSEIEELASVVEEIRKEAHPHLPATFLRAVIVAEESAPDDDQAALREILRALSAATTAAGSS